MIFGMPMFTFLHVLISFVAIVTGFVVLTGLLTSRVLRGWTGIFLLFTVLTSLTGFFFPRTYVLPSHIVGTISLVLLALAVYALYGSQLRGRWRVVYVITAVMALYLNVFVLVVQSFLKVAALHALAPNGSEPPFAIVQIGVFLIFIGCIFFAARRFHPSSAATS